MPRRTDSKQIIPDQQPITKLQAERLSQLTGASVKELAGVRPVDLTDQIKWSIDPLLWFYRKVCGKVVKKDPVTGVEYPVPNATVHVEDTDCSLILYSPINSKLSWFYPFNCRREELATVQTDECGRFCVWIPRWDIDWILSWRLQRHCFPVIFERPTIKDILEGIELIPIPPIGPPDPGPLRRLERFQSPVLSRSSIGSGLPAAPGELRRLTIGDDVGELADELTLNAFDHELQPPLPEEFVNIVPDAKRGDQDLSKMIAGSIADHVGLDPKLLQGIDLGAAIGPFRRCWTEIVPVWKPVIDVPDITFRVTQDVNGDGVEETIYGESYFQVRWDAGSIPPLKLQASSWALESRVCDAPPNVPCSDVPAITHAGLMPVSAAYHNNATGYAIKPNRPRPGGVPTSPATAPYCLNVNLFGCLPRPRAATQYRVLYRYAPKAGDPFSGQQPFTSVSWSWHPTAAPPVPVTTDPVTGWTPLPPAGVAGTVEEFFLFPFDTTRYTEGLYAVAVELGDGAGNPVGAQSAEVLFRTDNRAPTIMNSTRWSTDGGLNWTTLPTDCPVVKRGAAPKEVLFEVTWNVMAPAHYRDSFVTSQGCGASGLAPVLDPAPPAQDPDDWHTGPLDNAYTYVLTYKLGAGNAQGTYSFHCYAYSRAFNPSGYIADYQTNDWLSDAGAPIWNQYPLYFSVINANP